MGQKCLIVIDMQEDFVYGSLGTAEARAIVPAVFEKVNGFEGTLIFTKDTHGLDYMNTQEGRNLPVEHCVKDTAGWELVAPLKSLSERRTCTIYEKNAFGSVELAAALKAQHEKHPIESIELIGVCTDICVVSNALLLKAYLPEVPLSVDAGCCAGVTVEKHEAALETMQSCQIEVN